MSIQGSGGAGNRGGNGPRIDRRALLKTLATGAVLFESACSAPPDELGTTVVQHQTVAPHGTEPSLAPSEPPAVPPPMPPPALIEAPIVIENRLPGNPNFVLLNSGDGACEVYCSVTSAAAGDRVDVFVSVDVTQGVRFELYRIGYYQGIGARLVKTLPAVRAGHQSPYFSLDPTTGRIECDWSTTFSFYVEPAWVTGYYLIKVTNERGFDAHTPFIVRETGRVSPLLAQASVTTWQAYNRWGGTDLYSNLTDRSVFSGPRGYQASFDRPFSPNVNVWREEFAMVRFLEQLGYDVAYATNVDIDRAPELLESRQLFMTIGHDEYWSLNERNAVQAARDNGLSLAFFSGNTAYRRIRLEPSKQGVERRVITCYKSANLDPVGNVPDNTNDFAASPYARPENALLGLLWAGWSHLDGYPFTVSNPNHWVYEGTGVKANEAIGHIIGYEWDVVGNNGHTPHGLEVIGSSAALHEYAYISRAQASVYYPTARSFVFASGTIAWARALSEPDEIEPRLQRVTENILKRAHLLPELSVIVPPTPEPERGSSARAYVLAGAGAAGRSDGPASSAQFHAPCGIAVTPTGELIVVDNGSHSVRKISADGQLVTTLAGDAVDGSVHLNTPTGVAVDAEGTVYVLDTRNHRIVSITADGSNSVFAGSGAGNSDDSDPLAAKFSTPRGITIAADGAMYIADFANDSIRRIDRTGVRTVVSGCGGASAVAVAGDGTIYFIATWNGGVVRVTPDGTRTTIVNPSTIFGDRGGPGAQARLRPAEGLALTPNGLIVTDTGNNRVRLVAFDRDFSVSTLLGTGQTSAAIGTGFDTDVVFPRGVVAYNNGFAVTDCLNHRIVWFSA